MNVIQMISDWEVNNVCGKFSAEDLKGFRELLARNKIVSVDVKSANEFIVLAENPDYRCKYEYCFVNGVIVKGEEL